MFPASAGKSRTEGGKDLDFIRKRFRLAQDSRNPITNSPSQTQETDTPKVSKAHPRGASVRGETRLSLASIVLSACFASILPAQGLTPIKLPTAQVNGGRPLMQVLKDRKSTREFGPGTLSPQILSNLLWAAFGINRPDGRRTAPSAMNWQEVNIYVVTADGVYLYDAKDNVLQPVVPGDKRAATGTQSLVTNAAVNLVYVSDLSKTGGGDSPDTQLYIGADVGFIAQNVYLYCASEGLATVVRGSVDKAQLAKVLRLQANQRIILAQSVGYEKKQSDNR
jgi:SagB-type dehydrogenase family enzyme